MSHAPQNSSRSSDFIARLPAGIRTKRELFEAMDRQLLLPDYFGHNFDSLEECLRDLSWLSPDRIILLHTDVPFDPESPDRETYLEILNDCVTHWQTVAGQPDRLLVLFPAEATE